jgi:hypothetical protein
VRDSAVGAPLSYVIPITMNDSEFDELLKSARGSSPLPASFRQGVWSRIESADTELPREATWFQSVIGALLRPWGAATAMAATVVAGIWLGAASVPETRDAKVAYAESISPFAHAHRK